MSSILLKYNETEHSYECYKTIIDHKSTPSNACYRFKGQMFYNLQQKDAILTTEMLCFHIERQWSCTCIEMIRDSHCNGDKSA